MQKKKPTLCVVAGPNGSGKTTTTELLLANEWTENSMYINPDILAEQDFGGWNNPDAVIKAAQRATELRYECLADHRDFVFETVFSSPEKLEFLRKAHEAGFFIRLFYVCTKSPEINVARIAKRFMNGGHEVPISKVITRYFKSLEQARMAIAFVDRAYVYDNSVEDQFPQLLFRTVDGILVKQYIDDLPNWAKILV
ncbi:MAG: zeta toxin family protein [Bacteroidales bacterium]|nr:zeta toxin family protein [Bacteroidales bacterium]